MLLRRFMQHTKEQNWFAVGLDVVVVIVGIFLGMQVQQWYEEREFDAKEIVLLGKLKNEIETNSRLATTRIDFITQVKDSGERAIAFLEEDKPCTENCWSLLVDFFIASQATPTPSVRTVGDEMRRLGLPRSEVIKVSVDDFYVFSEAINTAVDLDPKYRELVRELMTSKAQKALWEKCHSFSKTGLEDLHPDCEPQLSDEEITSMLDRFRTHPDLLDYLNHWVGIHYIYIPMFKLQIEAGAETIAVIEEALNAG